ERLHADRAGSELLDDRGEELPIRRVEALVVDLHHPHRLVDDLAIDAATAVDLGMVADPLEQAIDDARRAPATAGDLARGVLLDRDAEDAGRAVDDRGEVVLIVEVESVRRPEAIAQRPADPSCAGRGADDRERLEAEPEGPRRRTFADHHIERVVLHRRVEDLLHGPAQAVDLVDEQDVPLVERGEDRGEVAGPLDGGTARVADAHAELARDDRRKRRLSEAGRAVEEDVIRGLSPAPRGSQEPRQVRLDLALAD